MAYFIVMAKLMDAERAPQHAPEHMAYMARLREAGTVVAHGRLLDGWGGVAVYRAGSADEVRELASRDPFVLAGIRSYEIHEWDVKLAPGFAATPDAPGQTGGERQQIAGQRSEREWPANEST